MGFCLVIFQGVSFKNEVGEDHFRMYSLFFFVFLFSIFLWALPTVQPPTHASGVRGAPCVAPPQSSAPEHSIVDWFPDLKMDPPLLDYLFLVFFCRGLSLWHWSSRMSIGPTASMAPDEFQMFGLGITWCKAPFAILFEKWEVLPTPQEELLWEEVLRENMKYFFVVDLGGD